MEQATWPRLERQRQSLLDHRTAIEALYADFAQALQSALVMHVQGDETVQMNPQAYFRLFLGDLYQRYINLIHHQASRSFWDVLDALGMDRIAYKEYVNQCIVGIVERISAQMQFDINRVTELFQQYLIRVQLLENQGKSKSNARISERERLLKNPSFRFDKLGRKRAASDYVLVEIHFALFRLHNFLAIIKATSEGRETMTASTSSGLEEFPLNEAMALIEALHPRSETILH